MVERWLRARSSTVQNNVMHLDFMNEHGIKVGDCIRTAGAASSMNIEKPTEVMDVSTYAIVVPFLDENTRDAGKPWVFVVADAETRARERSIYVAILECMAQVRTPQDGAEDIMKMFTDFMGNVSEPTQLMKLLDNVASAPMSEELFKDDPASFVRLFLNKGKDD